MRRVHVIEIINNDLLGLNKKLYHTNRITKKAYFQGIFHLPHASVESKLQHG